MAKSAEELLIYLFDEILPKHGMNLRVKQKELSLEMLRVWLYVRRKWGQEKLTHISLH